MSRRFTLREAESLLPQVSRQMSEALALKAECQEAEEAMAALAHKVMQYGGLLVDRERARAVRARRDGTLDRLKAIVESIQEHGCLVKDLDKGLVDFPTLFRGEEVYLCWKAGEEQIGFWHGVEEGFAGRKPIDQEFLDNHRGDPLT